MSDVLIRDYQIEWGSSPRMLILAQMAAQDVLPRIKALEALFDENAKLLKEVQADLERALVLLHRLEGHHPAPAPYVPEEVAGGS